MPHSAAAEGIVLYFVLPLWLSAGIADYICHRASRIGLTSGYRESLLHLLMLAEVAIPLLAAIFFEINALIIAIMITGLVLHQLTACGTRRSPVSCGASHPSNSTFTVFSNCCL